MRIHYQSEFRVPGAQEEGNEANDETSQHYKRHQPGLDDDKIKFFETIRPPDALVVVAHVRRGARSLD